MTVYDMPPYLVGSFRFWLERLDLQSPESSGRIGGIQMGWPKWRAEYEAVGHSDHEVHLWTAWLRRQRGAIHHFRATDMSRWYPYKYRPAALGGGHSGAGGFPGGWNGDATSFSLSGDRSEATLTIPSGIEITAGDLIGWRWGGGDKLALSEAMEGGVSSGTVTVAVEPAVHSVVPDSPTAVAYLFKPACLMRLTPETEFPTLGAEGVGIGKIVAQQDLVP